MTIKEVLCALEHCAPLPLQESYDNAGLQLGLTEVQVSGVLLCLDVTEKVVSEAERRGCNLIVSHHPLIFRALKRITDANQVQRTVMMALQKGITIASMHTNLDNARGGVNYKMAEVLNLHDVKFLQENNVGGIVCGSGVVGTLAEPMKSDAFIAMVKERFGARVALCNELLEREVKTVALCGGAGSFLVDDAVAAGADAFVTGEMHYHEYFGHEQEIQICVIGHYETEQYTQQLLAELISEHCPGVRTCIAETMTNPVVAM